MALASEMDCRLTASEPGSAALDNGKKAHRNNAATDPRSSTVRSGKYLLAPFVSIALYNRQGALTMPSRISKRNHAKRRKNQVKAAQGDQIALNYPKGRMA